MSKKSRKPNKAESAHMDHVAGMGCIVCLNNGFEDTPAAIHHIRSGQGAAQRASHYEVLPLCHEHHQGGNVGVGFHACDKTWQAKYGTERELLAQVRAWLGIECAA